MKAIKIRLTLLFISIIALGNSSIFCQHKTILSNEAQRAYILRLPQNYSGGSSYPLVIVLHGGGESAATAEACKGFTRHADTNGYIVVYPQGINNEWSRNSDVPFISDLIDTLGSNYKIDKSRVYLTGHSAGGIMVYLLACELSHKIAAFSGLSGFMVHSYAAYYKPVRPVPIMVLHGTGDNIISYYGESGYCISVDSLLNFWKAKNNSLLLTHSDTLPDINTSDNSHVIKYTYGENESEIVFYKVIGGGHGIPGSCPEDHMGGNINRDINSAEVVWDFFKEHTLNNLTITYIGNEGFLIQGKEKRVIIDALFSESYGYYLIPSAFTINKIQQNLKPFDNPDAFLVTHNHGDHFTASMVNEQMQNSPGTFFCGPQDVVSSLAAQTGYSGYSSRVVDLAPSYYNYIDTTINGIQFKVLRMHHMGNDFINVGYLFELNGIKILHAGDYGVQEPIDMDTFKLKDEAIDIAFVDYSNFTFNAESRETIVKGINAKHYVLMHVDKNLEKAIADSAAKYSNIYPATVFISSGDNKTYSKQADTIFGVNTNSCPVNKIPIPDTSAQVGKDFSFKIPPGCFSDADLFDQITYTATLSDGSALPDWLHFNAGNRTFSGIPLSTGTLKVKVTAVDKGFANISDIFSLEVIEATGINQHPEGGIKIFPNPVEGVLTITLATEPVKNAIAEIYNVNGKMVLQQILKKPSSTIDLTGYPAGMYFLKVNTGTAIINKKIIKK